MSCVAAMLARNEADRFLPEVLAALSPLCERILVLDDHSEDGTREVARKAGAEVRVRGGEAMWGRESAARQELWAWGAEVAGDGWLYIVDADHLTHADPAVWNTLCTAWITTAWCLPLYDAWDLPTQYRADGYWQGYRYPRPWLFRPTAVGAARWNPRGIHCGHAPEGDWVTAPAPEGVWINHLGWLRASDRQEKHSRYAAQSGILSEFERGHVASILETL